MVSFALQAAPTVAEGEWPDDVRRAVLGRVASLTVVRFGADATCAAGALVPLLGWRLSPEVAALAMAFSSVSVVSNSLRLHRFGR